MSKFKKKVYLNPNALSKLEEGTEITMRVVGEPFPPVFASGSAITATVEDRFVQLTFYLDRARLIESTMTAKHVEGGVAMLPSGGFTEEIQRHVISVVMMDLKGFARFAETVSSIQKKIEASDRLAQKDQPEPEAE